MTDDSTVPVHIGIIMDGNGRWAQKRNLPRTAGHKEGLETAKRIISCAVEAGVKYVTLYTFSTENWKRTEEEVGFLMGLITRHLRAEYKFYKEHGIRIRHIGDTSRLPAAVQKEMVDAEGETADFNKMTVVLAINYGGRDELIRAMKKLASKIAVEDIREQDISTAFDVPELPDADIIIRTGGEKRLSNFLLWHSTYSELFFSDTLWPDFSNEEFLSILSDFNNRDRRFGAVKR
ncbi:MAG: polyprenyl diphosphate synthase [Treponema sp.]|nr:di-trans,poly-cis-decaprenylcistransferase [Spirochaetaceae bacterium]MCI6662892.1 polyprenyl diphosphate synthase [Spirochaetia bacterium]MDY3754955.1 polyprenyl diphosphate synthase [Treponema sp.]MDY4674945.1 polyprenyl diphosphate synthase [Treponema sp.]